MNKTYSIGNLTSDPKITETSTGKKKAEFTLALNRIKEGADFPRFVAWEQKAELLEKYCRKGHKLAIAGHIHTGSYEGKNGKVYTTDIIVDEIEFLTKKEQADETAGQPDENPPDEWMNIPEGLTDDMPFT